jgi:hypothetical protein
MSDWTFGYKLLYLIISLFQNSARLEVINENRAMFVVAQSLVRGGDGATTATTLPQPYHGSCNHKFCSLNGSHLNFVFSSFPTFVSFRLQ